MYRNSILGCLGRHVLSPVLTVAYVATQRVAKVAGVAKVTTFRGCRCINPMQDRGLWGINLEIRPFYLPLGRRDDIVRANQARHPSTRYTT